MKRKKYTPEYKAKIVLEILKEEQTVSEIGKRENINPKQLHQWKKEFIENASRAFGKTKLEKDAGQIIKAKEIKENMLTSKVGELTIENEFLKKKYKQVHGHDWNPSDNF